MIECNLKINFGQPTLKGRRLTVYDIVTKIYYDKVMEETLSDYEISLRDAKDAIKYCMNLQCKKDRNLINYCDGCLLRTIQDGWDFKIEDYEELKDLNNCKIVISKEAKDIFIGSLQELEDSEFGKVTWLIAEEISNL